MHHPQLGVGHRAPTQLAIAPSGVVCSVTRRLQPMLRCSACAYFQGMLVGPDPCVLCAAPRPPRRAGGILLAGESSMHAPPDLRVWIVEPHDELRSTLHELVSAVPVDAEVMTEDQFRGRIDRGRRPDALMIDGSTLLRLDGQRAALDGMLRTLVVTGRHPSELPIRMLERSSVQFLRKPFTMTSIERGLAWLTGGGDDSWADPVTPIASETAAPMG